MVVQSITVNELIKLIEKIKFVHAYICNDIEDSYNIPKVCRSWINHANDCYPFNCRSYSWCFITLKSCECTEYVSIGASNHGQNEDLLSQSLLGLVLGSSNVYQPVTIRLKNTHRFSSYVSISFCCLLMI
uniref:Uncharacterized protein n=1 Tax=Lactuca sativa TaxID=4236 RepID=A0A9R1VSX7_LACSA|nr:hypothetical protein LSAT_V11C400201360 [Lactuca sativa]